MRHLAHKTSLLALAISLLFGNVARADSDALVHFDLTLAGYRLGMTLDDASAIRPIQFRQAVMTNPVTGEEAHFDAFIDHVYIEDIVFKFWLHFKENKVHKIIGRFSPEHIKGLARTLSHTLGPGEDKTRVFVNHAGRETRQTIYLWDYPTARVHLVGIADNDRYATIGLVAKEMLSTETVETE